MSDDERRGEDILEAIDDLIDRWYEGEWAGASLRDVLNMSSPEYAAFVERCEIPPGYVVPENREVGS